MIPVSQANHPEGITMKTTLFNIGDRAFYPAHGVGLIKEFKSASVLGHIQNFYVFELGDSGLRMLIPENNASRLLRPVVRKSTVKKVFDTLAAATTINKTNWHRRHKLLGEQLRSTCLFDIATVLRDLVCLGNQKELSPNEKVMLDKAKKMVVDEISYVTQNESIKIAKKVDKILGIHTRLTSAEKPVVSQLAEDLDDL
jgi:CarD family transcriptional regulator